MKIRIRHHRKSWKRCKSLANDADVLRLYPDPDASELKHAIAKQQNVAAENVFVGNGSDEVLAHIFKAFLFRNSHCFIQILPIVSIRFIASSLVSKPKSCHSMKISKLL